MDQNNGSYRHFVTEKWDKLITKIRLENDHSTELKSDYYSVVYDYEFDISYRDFEFLEDFTPFWYRFGKIDLTKIDHSEMLGKHIGN